MPELVSVTHQQFNDFIFYIRQRARVRARLKVEPSGDSVVQYQTRDAVVVGEITFSRQFATTWKVLPGKVQGDE